MSRVSTNTSGDCCARLARSNTSGRRARIESGLPELDAAGMNVFQYANLVFGCCQVRFVLRPSCCVVSIADMLDYQGCGVSTAKVDYLLRVRYCSPCAKTA